MIIDSKFLNLIVLYYIFSISHSFWSIYINININLNIYVHLGALICRLSRIVICTLLNILYFLSTSDVTDWLEDMDNVMFRL